ncbi:hypothetical protein HRG_010810 [Hirsutella rhossiliensis]|uniref:Uncharacterized protein n=1 Tax=Hirsutella rhossiliensis TaxID=111463 RepID=A0A9P8SE79_9HYPO|nr:uncharacterized protein HRG_10810 [Hirsutella rhossiliensis]KAH0958115.1 hypothetical protein HRG_10810 [Hirsutella rhossiliensis]
MMLVSVLGTVLAASAAVVPVAAVPCSKSSGAPSHASSAVASESQRQSPPPPSAVAVERPQGPAPNKNVPAVSTLVRPAGADGQSVPSQRPKCTKKPAGVETTQKSPAAGPQDNPKELGRPEVKGGVDGNEAGALPCTKCANKSGGAGGRPAPENALASDRAGEAGASKPCPKCAARIGSAGPGQDGATGPAPLSQGDSPASKPPCPKKTTSGTTEAPKPVPEPPAVQKPGAGPGQGVPSKKPCPKGATTTAGAGPGSKGDIAPISGGDKPGPKQAGQPDVAKPCTKCDKTAGADRPEPPVRGGSPASKPPCPKKTGSGATEAPKPVPEPPAVQKPGAGPGQGGPKKKPCSTDKPQQPKPVGGGLPSPASDQGSPISTSPVEKNDPPKKADDVDTASGPDPLKYRLGDDTEPSSSPKKTGGDAAPSQPGAPAPSASSNPTAGTKGTLGSEVPDKPGSVSVTPHEQYSSSEGVLGCMININRVAYWPFTPGCNDICIKVTSSTTGKSLHLLRIDKSGGARDISYQAWNELTGKAAGGGEPMTWEWADMTACGDLLHNGKMPFIFDAGIHHPERCLAKEKEDNSPNWISQNYELFNYKDARCDNGPGKPCTYNFETKQLDCPKEASDAPVKGPGIKDIPYNSLKGSL